MECQAENLLRKSIATLLLVLCVGCTAPWLPDYDVATFERYRIDVLDGNNTWNPVDPSVVMDRGEAERLSPLLASAPMSKSTTPTGAVGTQGSSINVGSYSTIHITFTTPVDYLRGFRDYLDSGSSSNSVSIVSSTGIGSGSGLVDDLDGDTSANQIRLLVSDENQLLAVQTDFGDSSFFNVRFESLSLRSYMQARGTQVERVIRFGLPKEEALDSEQQREDDAHTYLDVSYGARYLRLDNSYGWDASSDLFANATTVDTNANNQSFGPQIGLSAATKRKGWQFSVRGQLMFGMVKQDADQQGSVGESLFAGAPNQVAAPVPNRIEHQDEGSSYSTISEFLAQASYQLSDNLALQLGYTALHLGDMRSAEDSVEYRLPDMGLTDAGAIHAINIDGLFARLEYRR